MFQVKDGVRIPSAFPLLNRIADLKGSFAEFATHSLPKDASVARALQLYDSEHCRSYQKLASFEAVRLFHPAHVCLCDVNLDNVRHVLDSGQSIGGRCLKHYGWLTPEAYEHV